MMTPMMRRSSVMRSTTTTTVATTTMIKHPLWVPSAACGLGLLLLPLYLVSSWIKMGVLAFWALDHCRLLWVGTAHPWSVLCVWSECSNRDQISTVCMCDEPCFCGVSFSDWDLSWHQAWLLCPSRNLIFCILLALLLSAALCSSHRPWSDHAGLDVKHNEKSLLMACSSG